MKTFFSITVFTVLFSIAEAEVRYHVTDLTALATGSDIAPSVGYCINNNGDVAGHGRPTQPNSTSKPFLYDATTGTFINLGNLAGNFLEGKGGNGYGINNAGLVVGRNSMTNSSWNYRPFLFTDSNHNSTVDSGEMVNLTIDLQYGYGWAEAINNSGQVVGFSRDTNDDYHGWVWTDTDGNNIPDSEEIQYFAGYFPNSINDAGDMVLNMGINGYLWSDSNENGLYDPNELQLMPMPTGYFDETLQYHVTIHELSPVTVSNSKTVCGAAENYFGKANGFFWQDSNGNGEVESQEYTVFGSALKYTHVRAMNNKSQIVGGTYEYSNNREAYLWTFSEGMVNLNSAADPYVGSIGPRYFSQAEGINDNGQIVTSGWYDFNGDGKRTTADPEHVFILTPYLTGDITGDKKVSLNDFSTLSRFYGQAASMHPAADLDGSGQIDLGDLLVMVEDWGHDLSL